MDKIIKRIEEQLMFIEPTNAVKYLLEDILVYLKDLENTFIMEDNNAN